MQKGKYPSCLSEQVEIDFLYSNSGSKNVNTFETLWIGTQITSNNDLKDHS